METEQAEQEVQEEQQPMEEEYRDENAGSEEQKAMEDFLAGAESTSGPEWCKAWTGLHVPRQAEADVLSVLFEVGINKDAADKESGYFDFLPRIVVELLRQHKVLPKNVEVALKEGLSSRLETLIQANDQTWHILSYMLLYLFPRSPSTSWGYNLPWESWWRTTKEVLSAAQKYRAFDILVLLLQLMQEKSEHVIQSLPVWSESRRKAVKEVLCQWGDMDETAIVETLSAYGVDL
ncbi:unnamed protein product [Effrenium voratum]|uniref:Uncharacterized protein n=1 Tax=Effrenium voratum TaxID=2562239 RepID=A0AA36JLH3_9DINO|nr:unnamed protein product [Effrenium voratum]CAJ1408438.1 unnamed protein product [Effrenium voratum]